MLNAGAALGSPGIWTPLTLVNLVGGVLGRVLADGSQDLVQRVAQCVEFIIGERIEEQLTNLADVAGRGLLDSRPARRGESHHRASGIIFAELPRDKAAFDHSGDLMRCAASIPAKSDTKILGPQLPVRGLRQRNHDGVVGRRHAFLPVQLQMERGLQLAAHIPVGLPDRCFPLREPSRPSRHRTQASRPFHFGPTPSASVRNERSARKTPRIEAALIRVYRKVGTP